MATCKYTGIQFIPTPQQPPWTDTHPEIDAVMNAFYARNNNDPVYASAWHTTLDAATPFTLTDLPRLMAQAQAVGDARNAELAAAFPETPEIRIEKERQRRLQRFEDGRFDGE